MPIYVFDSNFHITGLQGVVPAAQGTVNTNAVTLSDIVKVDPQTGKTFTFAQQPTAFTVSDLPQSAVTVALSVPVPTVTSVFPQKIRCRLASNQTIPSASATTITFDTVDTGIVRVGAQLAVGVVTIKSTGTYAINAYIGIQSDSTMSLCILEVLVNGSTVATFRSPLSIGGSVQRTLLGHVLRDLRADQVVSVKVTATSAGTISVLSATSALEVVQMHAT